MNALRLALLTAATASFAASLPACKDDPLENVINPLDIPAGGRVVNPGVVSCGQGDAGCDFTQTPTECCLGPGAPKGGACFDAGATCPSGSGVVTCNEAADCLLTQVCCATMTPTSGGTSVTATCEPTCAAPSMQMCRTNGECKGTDKCVIQTCPDGLLYELCGTYSDPASSLQCSPR
jgi:hypothetical protein